MSNCSDEFPYTDALYAEVSGDPLFIVAIVLGCLLTVLNLCIYAEEVVFLMRHHHDNATRFQGKIVLLALFPVISFLSLIAILVPRSTVLVDLLAACYLSVCIHTFVAMTINLYGGDDAMLRTLKDDPVRLSQPPCCCCCCCILKTVPWSRSLLHRIKMFTLQVVIIKPLLQFIGAVLWTDGNYKQEFSFTNGYTYISFFSFVSTILSLYGMVVIYRASRSKLQHYAITLKFLPVKLCFLLVNLQHFIFTALAQRGIPECVGTRGPHVRVEMIYHGLLILEMILLALLARRGYRRVESIDVDVENTSINGKQVDTIHNKQVEAMNNRPVEGIDNPVQRYGSVSDL